jgi:hypothetical protein
VRKAEPRNAPAEKQPKAIEDMRANAASGLCALASLLENQKDPLSPDSLADVAQLACELATMGAVGIV